MTKSGVGVGVGVFWDCVVRKLCAFGVVLAWAGVAKAQAPAELVKDINTAPFVNDGQPQSFVAAGNTLFFTATTETTGRELWKTDGTTAGTVLVKDIWPGADSGVGDDLLMTAVNGILYFWANDGLHGNELWRSDGTAAGTIMVKDIVPGSEGNAEGLLTEVNGTLFFTDYDGTGRWGLWKSDGTEAGTLLVKSVSAGGLTNLNGTLFFTGNEGAGHYGLWKSDGSEAGTVLIKSIAPPSSAGALTNANGTLLFTVYDGGTSTLWKSDGSEAGTVLVKAFAPGSWLSGLTNVNGTLFFTAYDGVSSTLWKSDGSEAGTVVVKAFAPGSSPLRLTNVNGTLFFTAYDGVTSRLWKSDGTEAGTVLVKDIGGVWGFASVNGTVFFSADDGVNGQELWRSDGSEAGTVLVKDLRPGSDGSSPSYFTGVGGTVFFTAYDGEISGLWKSDGTEAGTVLVRGSFGSGNEGSWPRGLIDVNGTLFFQAYDNVNGWGLWKSDGTAAGTVLLKSLGLGPLQAANLNGTLYFQGCDAPNRCQLWKSDGTEAGTVLVKDILPGSDSSSLGDFTNVNGTLFFTAYDGTGAGLWKSDGTDAGTVLVKSINAGMYNFVNVSGTLFFKVGDYGSGWSLWKSDGTEAGTVVVKSGLAVAVSNGNGVFTSVNGILFFVAYDGSTGYQLWKSDGTEAGTVPVSDVGDVVGRLTNVNGTLFFLVFNKAGWPADFAIWKSDGTGAGTVLVKDMGPRRLSEFTAVNGVLYFTEWSDDGPGIRLWKSDGTEGGTVVVRDIYPADVPSPCFLPAVTPLANVNGFLYFATGDCIAGDRLWKSDGTAAGTVALAQIGPETGSVDLGWLPPDELTRVGNDLYFSATGLGIGRELWRLPHAATCGNGVTEDGEPCDDGNNVNGDGCDIGCTITACGNGQVSAGEECDDGNRSNTDACTNECKWNVCGDGAVFANIEACDDRNQINGDGCDNNCTVSSCGNGILTAGEQCDEGLANGSPASCCSTDCTFKTAGIVCRASVNDCDIAEACTGSSAACPPDINPACTPTPTPTPRPAGNPCTGGSQCLSGFCVDGVCCASASCPSGEFCNISGSEGACAPPLPTPTPTPRPAGDPCTGGSQCLSGFCVDGVCCASASCPSGQFCNIPGLEGTCAPPATATPAPTPQTPTPSLTPTVVGPVCGNGVVESGEECDDGNTVGGDGCSATCRLFDGCPLTGTWSFSPDPSQFIAYAEAPDGSFSGMVCFGGGGHCSIAGLRTGSTVQFTEVCGGSSSFTETMTGCDALPGWGGVRERTSYCGDGVTDPGEQCDDGNFVDHDGCSPCCTLPPVCGNGVVEEGEECDDGNTTSGDGCSALCKVEDVDRDGIREDGDGSGVAGDAPCRGGAVAGCDDNCPGTPNPDQADSDGDGIGDLCDYNCTGASGALLSGTIYRDSVAPGNGIANAWLSVTGSDPWCESGVQTNASGAYTVNGLKVGSYVVRAYSPGPELPGGFGPLLVETGTESFTGRDIVLKAPMPPPPGTSIGSSQPGQIPVVRPYQEQTLTTQGSPGGTATYRISKLGTVIASGPMTEGPSGTYTAVIPAGSFSAGAQNEVSIEIVYPDMPTQSTEFDAYIDPSGVTRYQTGGVAPNAIVVLYRGDSADGPFEAVPDGSAVMSPKNRRNPDATDAAGHFGWDVIPGFYKVTATTAGCLAESAVLTIPPAVTDIELVFQCPCVAGPLSGCRSGGKSQLILKNHPTKDAKDQVVWKVTKGASTTQAEFGAPMASTNYALCVFQGDGSARVAALAIPADSQRWKPVGGNKGFKYVDPGGGMSGVRKVLLKGSSVAKTQVLVNGKGIGLPDLPLGSLVPPVRVQLQQSGSATCFEATFGATDVISNGPGEFKAKIR